MRPEQRCRVDDYFTSASAPAVEQEAVIASEYKARTIALTALTPLNESQWSVLSDQPLEPNPFFTPAYLLPALKQMHGADSVLLVIVERADMWAAVLPLTVEPSFRGLPLRYASTAGGRFLGKFPSLCAPLIHREHVEGTVECLLRHLVSQRSMLPGLVELTLLPLDGPIIEQLRSACHAQHIPLQEASRFSRPYASNDDANPAPFHLSNARMKQLRRNRNALERETGAPLEFVDHGHAHGAFSRLLELEAIGWRGRNGSAFLNRPQRLAWFTGAAKRFSDHGHVFELQAGDVTLYLSYVVMSGNAGFGVLDAYNEDYAKYSPGILGRMFELQHMLSRVDIDAFDPCIHPARYAEASRYYPGQRELVSVLLAPRGAARWLLRLRPIARSLRGLFRRFRSRSRPTQVSE